MHRRSSRSAPCTFYSSASEFHRYCEKNVLSYFRGIYPPTLASSGPHVVAVEYELRAQEKQPYPERKT